MTKKIASVPYDLGKSYDFYEDRFRYGNVEILYTDIKGYGYLLTRSSTSVNLIPTNNSTSFTVKFDIGDRKPFSFGRHASAAMRFKTEKQRTIDLIFSEVVKCIEALIAPHVFYRLVDHLLRPHSTLKVGGLTISRSAIAKKGVLGGEKLLPPERYSHTTVQTGQVSIWDIRGKKFFSCPLSTINAPLLGPILDTLFSKE